jgi:PKHD-type hydroxylase
MIVTLPDLLDAPTLDSLRHALVGASWQDGRGSAEGTAREVKHNLVVPHEHPASQAAGRILLERLSQHAGFKAAALPKLILSLQLCRYDAGMSYGDHLDLPLMGTATGAIRTDISMTVFLSDGSDYDGGDLVFATDYGTHRVRGQAGEAVLYPSSTLHRVEPVVRGSRQVAITWIQSLVRDAAKRKIVFDLAQVATQLDAAGASEEHVRALRQAQFNLLRLWAEP